jgi:hypothetical protein
MSDFWKLLADAGMDPGLALVAAAAVVAACALAALRGGSQVRRVLAVSAAVVVAAAVTATLVLDHFATREFADRQRALDGRVFDLKMRALAPGSALACLDPTAGDFVQESCERAIFASPEATAAAISYVTEQLSLLELGSQHARASGLPSSDALIALRRSVEADRFGIVAYLFARRSGCESDECDFFHLLQDASRVRANLAAHLFESYVKAHTADWQSAGMPRPAASSQAPAPPAASPSGAAKPASNLFFPSASSIPPVSIMTPEPPLTQAPNGASASADPPARARKPSQGIPQGRTPTNADSGQAPSAPLQIVPSVQ